MTIASGTKLGRYEIRSKIGQGGMGEVYLAHDTELNRKVALKILPAELAVNQDRMRRFVQEAKAAAALNHPNVAHVYEIGERDGVNFIAMEYVEGKTLREKIHYERTELRKLIKYLQQVAGGLAKAHAAGIVHRDLKPDNIMITPDGYAKILDFGLAKLIEIPRFGAEGETVSDAETVAQVQYSIPGRLIGTVGYMSPEQAQGKIGAIDHRSDIFSFGCMLFEAATKHRPFEGESNVQSLYKIVYEPAPQLKDFVPSASPALQRVIRRCLAKDPDERYQSIQDIALELKELRREMEGDTQFDDTATGARPTSSASTYPTSSARPTSSAEYITTEIKRHKKGAISIASLGTHYVITLEAINAQTGDAIAREQAETENKEQVLHALGEASMKLREKLGESLQTIQKFDAPIEQATTSSLEAFKAFSLGVEQQLKGKYLAAIPFLKH